MTDSPVSIEAWGASDIGRTRDSNEDAFGIDEELKLYLVCDGMGGHQAGDFASSQTVEFVTQRLGEKAGEIHGASSEPGGSYRILELVESVTVEACSHLHKLAQEDPAHTGMGTTMTLLLIVGNKGIMAHVGDSRLYLIRAGATHLLSNDHTFAYGLFRQGVISAEDVERHPYRGVLTKSLGTTAAVEPEMLLFDIYDADRFVLCSDGFSMYLEGLDELSDQGDGANLQAQVQNWVARANERGGEDNITVVALQVNNTGSAQAAVTRATSGALARTFLAESLSYRRLAMLSQIAELRHYDTGVEIIAAGSDGDGLYFVASGRVGTDASTTSQGEGSYLLETSLVDKFPSPHSYHALEPTTMLFVSRKGFKRIVKRHANLGRILQGRLLRYFAHKANT